MKKSNLFWVMMMALIVMSCSKDETTMSIPQESNAITFGTYVGRDAKTRATALDITGLQTTGFGVFAYYTNGGDYTVGTSTPNFMYNTKVSSASWTYAPIKYWPNEASDKLTFFAYAPYSTGSTNNISDFTANTATGDPKLTFTVDNTATAQTDLLYADANAYTTPTVLPGLKNLGKQTIGGKVNFPFKHALSRIGFNVEVMADVVNPEGTGADDVTGASGTLDTETVVSVEKVELIGTFATSNTFNFAAGEWGTPPTTTGATTYELVTANFETFATTAGTGVTTAKTPLNKADSYLMIIPKTFTTTPTADPLEIRVTYTVTTADTALNGGSSAIKNVITSAPFAFTFEAGKAYSFNLHLGLTSVKFSATVTGWDETSSDTVVNVPINTAP
ncbi:MAG: fimbrillin family protein [Proteiniphilum sp.]|nr:fimbrillin family protein [Proteiniphilum sp.]